MRTFVSAIALLGLCSTVLLPCAAADQVTMKNGDRLTGSIVTSDSKTLVLKTDYAGRITLKWDAIAGVASTGPMFVTSKTGQVFSGEIEAGGEEVRVGVPETGSVTLSRSTVAAIRSPEEQRLARAWSGSLDAGFSMARGNSGTTNLNLGVNAVRETMHDKTSVFVTSLFSRDRINGVTQTTANAVRGGLRYDHDLGQRTFASAFTELEHDRFQQLDLRNVLGGGIGYHAIKNERATLDFNTGASLDQEFFSGLTRRSGEALLRDELNFKVGSGTSLLQRFTFYPNLTDRGEYRLGLDLGATTRINQWLGWQISLSDRTVSNPLPMTKKNDLLLTTGLKLVFGSTKL